jgi:hypothetical protein
MAKQKDATVQTETNATKAQNGKPAEEKPARVSIPDAALKVVSELTSGTEVDLDTLTQAAVELVVEGGGRVTADRMKADVRAYCETAKVFGVVEIQETVVIRKVK